MSEINVNKIAPSTGTNVTLGDSSDTFKVPSGVTLDVESGATLDVTGATVSGLTSTTINNNADNRVITGSGTANTLNGESTLTFTGSLLSNTAETAGGFNTVLQNDNGTAKGLQVKIKANDSGQENNEAFDVTTWDSGSTYTSKLRVNRNGNAIIKNSGSSSTTETLVLTNGTSGNPSYSNLVFKTAGNTSGCWIKGVQASGGNDGRLEFHTNTSGTVAERMRILDDGTVNISTTGSIGSNQGGLHVSRGNGQNGNVLYLDSASTNYDANIVKMYCAATSTNETFNFLNAQNGTASVFFVRDSGNVENANNSYGSSSDERIKQDITDASSQWDDIKAVKVRSYKLKSNPTKTQLGVVAQELETANMNGLVGEAKPLKENVADHSDFGTIVDGTADNGATPIKDDDGNITGYEDVFTEGQKVKSVKYSVLYMKAIKALQESMERIEQLEAKVTALENA